MHGPPRSTSVRAAVQIPLPLFLLHSPPLRMFWAACDPLSLVAVHCYLVEVSTGGFFSSPQMYFMEAYVEGQYVKHSSNAGWAGAKVCPLPLLPPLLPPLQPPLQPSGFVLTKPRDPASFAILLPKGRKGSRELNLAHDCVLVCRR